jgi:hypothetical protein
VSAFREIRGVRQRGPYERRRWFQSPFFDLFVRQDAEGEVQWFQLCYARDTWRERVLEWHRGFGFEHFRVRDGANPLKKDAGALEPEDAEVPYVRLMEELDAAAGLPAEVRAFISAQVRARLRFLDSAEGDR